jgi:hypothetical protein
MEANKDFSVVYSAKVRMLVTIQLLIKLKNRSELTDGIHIFIPKIIIWVHIFRKSFKDNYWYMVYFIAIWKISRSFSIFYGDLEYLLVIWYISWRFGMLYQ